MAQVTMWGEAAKNSYNKTNIPKYAEDIKGPIRKYYINEKRSAKEIISANVQVNHNKFNYA